MSTQFTNRQWRLPNNENKDKQSNYSMDFDGNVQHIKASNFSGLADKSSGSFSLWFKTTNTTSNAGKCILSIPYSGGGNGFDIYINNSTSLKSYLKTSTFTTTTTNTITYGDSNWHHVAVVYDGSTHKIYFDTVDVTNTSTPSPSGAIAASTVNTIEIGRFSTSYQNEFNGQIDGVAIFNYALSTSQITTLYGSSSTGIGNPMSLSPKPVAYYPLGDQDAFNGANYLVPNIAAEEDDGDIATSYSPYALDFDAASSNYIDCGNITSLNNLSAFSTSTWINYEGTISGASSHMFLSGGSASNNRFYVQLYSSNQIRYGYNGNTIVTTSSMSVGNWYNIVTVHNGTSLDVYLNGVKQNTSPVTVVAPSTNIGNNFQIGKYFALSSYYWDGKLSNASIWNTDLTSSQVTELYNEGVPSNLNNHSAYSNLVSWWQLGSNSSFNTNWTVLDEVTASGNNGTSSNMTEDDIVDGVGSYANGLSSGMGGDEVIGDAPYSTANSLSVNMDVLDRVTDTPS